MLGCCQCFCSSWGIGPTIEIWTDASLEHGGGLNFHGGFVQRSWTSSDLADDPNINLLETRDALESAMALSEPGDCVRLHSDNRTAAAYIRCQGGTKSNVLSQEALLLCDQVVSRDITLLPPHWIPTGENTSADFLSRSSMAHWSFRLDRRVFGSILEPFTLQPIWDAFPCHYSA